MKQLLSFLNVLFAFSAGAQITVTQTALPVVGENWGLYSDQFPGPEFAITPAGPAAQTWDYADDFEVGFTAGQQWLDPSPYPGLDLFPDVDLAVHSVGSAGGVEFYHAGADGLYDRGYYGGQGAYTSEFHITDGLMIPVPFTYGSSRAFARNMTGLEIYSDATPAQLSVFHHTGSYECDAWGTLHTPAYPDGVSVLRIRYERSGSLDTVYTDATGTGSGPWVFSQALTYPGEVYYLFIQAVAPYLVMGITEDHSVAAYFSGALPNGLPEPSTPFASVAYPVPCSGDLVHIAGLHPDVRTVQVCNALGEEVMRLPARGVEVVHIGTGAWATGTYTYRCLRSDGSLVDRGRFVIVR